MFCQREKGAGEEGEGSPRGDAHIWTTSETNRTKSGNRKWVSVGKVVISRRQGEGLSVG